MNRRPTHTCMYMVHTHAHAWRERGSSHSERVFNYFENAVKMMSLSNREYFIMPLFITLFYSITF